MWAIGLPPLLIAGRELHRRGQLGWLVAYLLAGMLGWGDFVFLNPIEDHWPIGTTLGVSNWYPVVMTLQAMLIWRWRRALMLTPARARAQNCSCSDSPTS